MSCWVTLAVAGLSDPNLFLISADVFRLLLKANFMSQASRMNLASQIPTVKYRLSGARYQGKLFKEHLGN
jgi:hypothetical protein